MSKDIRNIQVGDVVSIKDEQTLEELFKSGKSRLTSLDLQVTEILTITEANDIVTWKRVRFTDGAVILIIKQVENEYDVRSCFVPEGFQSGDRQDLADAEWLGNIFDLVNEEVGLLDLEFLRKLEIDYDDIGLVEFMIKGGVLYGSDGKGRFCGVAEWSSSQDCPNPEIIAFEIGGEEATRGGYIELYQGVNLYPEEYDIL